MGVGGGPVCGIDIDRHHRRICLVKPTVQTGTSESAVVRVPPNYMVSPRRIGLPLSLQFSEPPKQAPHLHDVMLRLCGCTFNDTDNQVIDSPSQMCRSNTLFHTCYRSDSSTCDDGDFNCGTYYGYHATEDMFSYRERINRLCRSCAPLPGPTVGQCIHNTTGAW